MTQAPSPSSALPPTAQATVDAWRAKVTASPAYPRDALLPVLGKALDTMATVLRPDGHPRDFIRALGSLDHERANSLQFDGRRESTVRSLTYGLVESLHATLHELASRGWRPAWSEQQETKPEPASPQQLQQRQQQQPAAAAARPQEEREQLVPLFADVKTEEPWEGEQEQANRVPGPRNFLDDFGTTTGGGDDDDGEQEVAAFMEAADAVVESAQAVRRANFSRAMSMPAPSAAASSSATAGAAGKERKRKLGKLGCPLCEWHHGNSPGTVIGHLRVHHATNPTAAGIYFRCQCGFVTRSNNHTRSVNRGSNGQCKEASFSIVKEADEEFAPKRVFSNNLTGAKRAKTVEPEKKPTEPVTTKPAKSAVVKSAESVIIMD